MHHLSCGEIWGGIRDCDDDVASAGMTASLYSLASAGGKGGDIYYLSLCENKMLTRMILADVNGHGEDVSNISTCIYDALKMNMNTTDGDKLLTELNRTALRIGLEAMTTVVMASFYKLDGNLYYVNAGHPPALIKPYNENMWQELKLAKGSNDPILGVLPETVYSQSATKIDSGDCLFLYSDGVVEAYSQRNGFFTANRLKDLLNQHPENSPFDLKHIVIDEIRRFAGGSLIHDDVTLMIVKID